MKQLPCPGALAALVLSLGSGACIAAEAPIGAPQDWSSRSVIHRQAMTPDEFRAQRRETEMRALYRDPRYVASLLRRIETDSPTSRQPGEAPRATTAASTASSTSCRDRRRGHCQGDPDQTGIDGEVLRDWSNVLGGGTGGLGGSGIDGVYPAKYNFDILAAPSCGDDFVVYPTNAPGASASGVNETYVSSFSGDPGQASNDTVTIGLAGVRQVVLRSSASDNTGSNFRTSGSGHNSNEQRAANLRDAVNRWTGQTGFRAVTNGAEITIISETTGDIDNGAISENLSYFSGGSTWPGVNGSGGAGQPTVVAFNQLYQGPGACNGSWNANGTTKAPNVLWAYNTGNGFRAETSPVLSYLDNGKQVAFVQRNGGTLQLVLLKWQAGQGTAAAPFAPALAGTAAAYRGCVGSCYYTFTLQTGGSDSQTWSSPFVDYSADTLWVGDTQGRLHKFTGVFQGTPAVAPSFPVSVASNMKLSSPVAFNGNVYVGSQSGASVGGSLHRVGAVSGTVASSVKLAVANSIGLRASPIVDGFTGSVFVFVFNDGSAGDGVRCTPTANNANACRLVARFATGFANGAQPLQRAYVGRGNSTLSTLFAGGFDDDYYTSPTASGALYIVGGAPADTFVPTLWKIPISSGAMTTPLAGPVVGSKSCGTNCNTTEVFNWSPVTVMRNGSQEYLYFGMGKTGSLAGCTGACLYMFNLKDLNGPASGTGAAWNASAAPTATLATPGGSGGIIVDNVRPEQGASQIYFAQPATTGNAIQVSQSALQ